MAEPKKKGPSDTDHLQQRIPAMQLVYTPTCIGSTFFICGIFSLMLGLVLYFYAAQVIEVGGTYSSSTDQYKLYAPCPDTSSTPCTIPIIIEKDMPGPVFFYYTLTNFYANHRRFASSRSDVMNRGDFTEKDAILKKDSTSVFVETCEGFRSYEVKSSPNPIIYYPCGLIARSMFNDSFQLASSDNSIVPWTSEGISGKSSGKKFVSKDVDWFKKNCYRYGPLGHSQGLGASKFPFKELQNFSGTNDASTSSFDCWHYVQDEELMVWMRTSMNSNFWKLNRIIKDGLKKGTYQLTIDLNYPVAGFQGTKGYVLTTATSFGGKQYALAIVYLVIGSCSLAFSVIAVFLRGQKIVKPEVRSMPDNIPNSPPRHSSALGSPGASAAPVKAVLTRSDRVVEFPPGAGKFVANYVSTTKYSLLTFLPKNLFLQLQRFATAFSLVVAALASIPMISPLGSSTFWVPLLQILICTAIKDAKDDYNRYLSDVEENSRKTKMFDPAGKQFVVVPWDKVEVGSLILVETGDDSCSPIIPADLALLATSAEDGTAFVETANLDGETNLKLREAPSETQTMLTTMQPASTTASLNVEVVSALKLSVSCGEPDVFVYDFNGKLQIAGSKDIALNGGSSGGQLLQRSTKLKNTKWVVGVAVYTGKESKIQMNMNDPPNKVSNVEHLCNRYFPGLAVLYLILCMIGGVLAGNWQTTKQVLNSWYLMPTLESATFNVNNVSKAGFIVFFSHMIVLSYFVSMTVYFHMELAKFWIASLICNDREMYAEADDIPSKARSTGLCEELGQVSYIFSDKTGTLTQNVMEFKKCSIAGVEYGEGFCEVERAIARRQGKTLPADPEPPAGMDPGFRFVDARLLKGAWETQSQAEIVKQFLLHLALNHTVQVDNTGGGVPVFQAESPDEGAFVAAARNLGFAFSRRNMKDIFLRIQDWKVDDAVGSGAERRWTVLHVNPFDNNRKRTSVVVEDEAGGKMLLVKGADTSVMPFVDHAQCPFFTETQRHIDKFGDQGLRTLAFAGRALSPAEYTDWSKRFHEASVLSQGREEALRVVASEIEEGHLEPGRRSAIFDSSTPYKAALLLHGVTALEDKLQENVGHCIAQLAKAMIKIWVLTGDKLETAINIGFATALLTTEMEPLLRVSQDEMARTKCNTPLETALLDAIDVAASRDAVRLAALAAAMTGQEGGLTAEIAATAKKVGAEPNAEAAAAELATLESRLRELLLRERVCVAVAELEVKTREPRAGGYALIIDGPCLRAATHPDNRWTFLKLGLRCKAVVCCRVTPAQKAEVTLLVKDNVPGKITLAIGDGANDVSMIQAAHVGVGIRGKEGQQAVLASDYALPRFAYLERLLLIHGRWSYNRIGNLVIYDFYLKIILGFTVFWYTLLTGFSAQTLFDDGYLSLYGFVLTNFHPWICAVLDRDIEARDVLALPELYSVGQLPVRVNLKRFLLAVGGAFAHSLLLFFVTCSCLNLNVSDSGGKGVDIYSAGTSVFTNILAVVLIVTGIITRSFTYIHWIVLVGSFGLWFLYLVVYSSLPPGYSGTYENADNVYNVIFDFGSTVQFWLTLIATSMLCCLPMVGYKFIKERIFPNLDDYYRHNLPSNKQRGCSNLSPAQTEAPSPPVDTAGLQAEAPSLDRNKEPSLLQHVRSRSDFTPAPPPLDCSLVLTTGTTPFRDGAIAKV